MGRFIEGESRYQGILFPEKMDDFVEENSVARVIDYFVDGLNLEKLGFKATPATTGRPGYHPGTMLKFFVYGYVHKIHSSRRLEGVITESGVQGG